MSKFCLEDRVLFKHPTHSWVVGVVKGVTDNRSYKPQPSSAALADAPRKRENSKLLYQIHTDDALMKTGSELVSNIEEWNVDIYDESVDTRPVDDLLALTHLHDGTVLRTLVVRYFQDVIYTNIGVIVVAINPFNTKIPHYQDGKMAAYLACKDQMIPSRLLPHSWSQAHNTFVEMCQSGVNQSILISGESGAGKTEAAKIVLRYLSLVSAQRGNDEEKASAQRIASTIGNCSPILEAFGNAKTVRNNNSSRFGKLLDLKFDPQTMLLRGAFTTKYLLEKSRIVTCSKDERLFHAFYLALICPDAKGRLKLTEKPESYRSVYSGSVLQNEDFSTVEEFGEVVAAMSQVGMTQQQVRDVWTLVAACIHAENVLFKPNGEGSAVDEATKGSLATACELWGVGLDAVLSTFVKSESNVRGQVVVRLHNVAKAFDSRDALVKALYANLFEWLVEKCNAACSVDSSGMNQQQQQFVSIALLDIFGFESFQVNSFEQLCINFANESLQQHYNWCIFTKDMETCQAEGIDTVDITFPNLQPTLDLISKVLSQLDDACAIGSAEDKDYLQGLVQSFSKSEPAFTVDLTQQNTFGINHYAGTVTYNVKNWIEKNRDSLSPAVKSLFATSTNPLAAVLLELSAVGKAAAPVSGGRASNRVVTVGGFFKSQMAELMQVINSTNPHWIRCVKPHVEKKPRMLLGPYTFRQLEFSGILGTVKIRRAGYPVRFPIEKFVLQFNVILPIARQRGAQLELSELRAHAIRMLTKMEYLDKKHAQVGKTIVFIKSETYHLIEQHKKNATQAFACLMQGIGRGYKRRVKLLQLLRAVTLQRIGRGALGRMHAFDLYCEKNQEKILAMRAKREAEQKAREEEESKRRMAQEKARKQQEEEMKKWLDVFVSQQRHILSAEEEARDAIESQYGSICDEIAVNVKKLRQHFLIERAKERFYKKLQPIAQLFFSLTSKLEAEEADEFLEILREAWDEKQELVFVETLDKIVTTEAALRRALRAEWANVAAMLDEAAVDTQQRVANCRRREELEETLRQNRQRREQARLEHHERSVNAERSKVEKVLFNALFRREEEEEQQQQQAPLSGTSDARRQYNSDRLFAQRLAAHTAVDAAATSSSSPKLKEQQEMLRSRNEGRLPIRAVEIGMTVFVPSYCQDGVVKALMPEVKACYLVELALSKRSVWLEPSDMEAARVVGAARHSELADMVGTPSPARSSGRRSLGNRSEAVPVASSLSPRAGAGAASLAKAGGDAFAKWKREQELLEKRSSSTSPQGPSKFTSWQAMASMLED